MRRSTIFLSTAAVLVLGAGLVVGRLSARLPMAHGHGWFQETLGLTPEQHRQMDAIWADAKQQMDKNTDRRRSLDKERDAAIRRLLTPEQSAAYDKIFQDYHAHRADLDKARGELFHSANDRSRALLTPDQQLKWDAMSKDMRDRRGGPPGRNRASTRPDAVRATTGPA